MSRFVQLHILTAYPPSNPNRDDLGRPKTAMLGGVMRQRISSQAIKRAIRTSPVFESALQGHLGKRSRRFGAKEILPHLLSMGIDEKTAIEAVSLVTSAIGDLDSREDAEPGSSDQLLFLSSGDVRRGVEVAYRIAKGEIELSLENKKAKLRNYIIAKEVLGAPETDVEIALFGRMLTGGDNAAAPYSVDGSIQVSHAITTNKVTLEDDYYTAVDDLSDRREQPNDTGAGFVGEAGFGAGVFYLYICIDRALLIENLAGDRALAARAIEALVRAAAVASPSGKRNSFANHVRAEYVLAERGDGQPRTLASAFVSPVGAGDQVRLSRDRLIDQRVAFAAAYGQDWRDDMALDTRAEKTATIDEIAAFAADELPELPQ